MDDLLVRALDGAAADAVASAQVLVVPHARRIVRVVADQAVELVLRLGGRGLDRAQARGDLFDLARAQVLGEASDPAGRHRRGLAKVDPGELPRVFDRMPKVEDLAADGEQLGAGPDPFRAVAYDDHDRLESE